jgi:ABC-2 type transport system permease protein
VSAITALLKKSKYHFLNTERILEAQSRFKVVFVLCFAFGFEAALWILFYDGFRFLDSFGGMGAIIIGRLFSLFFFGMGIMLVVSSIVSSYSTIYRSEEIPFLIVRPFEISEIVGYKFLAATGLSSWAFFFIIIPFVGAYAQFEKTSLLFAVWTLMFSIPFLLLCSGIGAIVVMVLVRWFPGGRFLKWTGVLLGVGAVFLMWFIGSEVHEATGEAAFDMGRLVPGIRMAGNALLPSWWVSEGIASLSRGQWGRGSMLWLVLASTAGVVYLCVDGLGRLTYYEGWQRVIGSRGSGRRRAVLLRSLDRCLGMGWIPRDVRALVMKEVRTFLRDPLQWSQALIFFGLLGIYFANLRSFHYHNWPAYWRNIIAFANVFSVSAVMCSLGSRFVYPQLSLEGQGFWILGLSPTTMAKIVLTKFMVALLGMLTVSVVLVLLSSNMLDLPANARGVAVALVCAVSLAVCSFSTGLGAMFIDLRQQNPAAIVSGFGGTLNLVLSLGFMLASIVPFAVLFHLRFMKAVTRAQLRQGIVVVSGWLVFLTVLSVAVPLWLGIRSLQRRDF